MTQRLDPWELWEPDEYVPTPDDFLPPERRTVQTIDWQGPILRLNAESSKDQMLAYPDSFAITPDDTVELWLQVDGETDLQIGQVTSQPWYEQRMEDGVLADVLCVAGTIDLDAVTTAMPSMADQLTSHQQIPVAVTLADATITPSGSVAIYSGPWHVTRLTIGNWVNRDLPEEIQPGGWPNVAIQNPAPPAVQEEPADTE